jgi:hypothetical protein
VPGRCWTNSDCQGGVPCVGAFVCPCNARCGRPDAPGTCGGPTDAGP